MWLCDSRIIFKLNFYDSELKLDISLIHILKSPYPAHTHTHTNKKKIKPATLEHM
jgi:hypothetical protein